MAGLRTMCFGVRGAVGPKSRGLCNLDRLWGVSVSESPMSEACRMKDEEEGEVTQTVELPAETNWFLIEPGWLR